jgi:hypothetical protein
MAQLYAPFVWKAAQRSRLVSTGPAARAPAESPKATNACWRARRMSLGEQSSDSQGQLSV